MTEPHRQLDESHGLFGISVVADLVGVGVQTLRLYEQRGLLDPDRTVGGTRRYSVQDVARLRHIVALVGAGLNVAGVAAVLTLEARTASLEARLRDLEARSTDGRKT